MEPATIIIIIGFATLVIERIASWAMKIKSSKCMGTEIEMVSVETKN